MVRTRYRDTDPAELYNQIRNGNSAAEEMFCKELSKRTLGGVLKKLGNRSDSEDLVQELSMEMLLAARNDRVRDPALFWQYCWSSAKTKVKNVYERRSRVEGLGNRTHKVNPSQLEDVIEESSLEFAHKLIADLPDRDRQIMKRFYIDEDPADVIKNDLNLTESQWRNLKSKCLIRMKGIGLQGASQAA